MSELSRAAVDNSAWDGAAAMSACSSAADFRQIAFEKTNDSGPDTAAHWGLPHHARPGAAPNAKGVSAALGALNGARGGVEGLVDPSGARKHLEAHQATIQGQQRTADEGRRVIVRAMHPALELRDAGDGAMPVMTGYFSVYNEWAPIDSRWEGRFMEQVAPGAFDKTLAERADSIRVLYEHGKDAQIGNKILGVPTVLRSTDRGGYFEVPLFDTSYNRDLLPGLQAGAYGASFRGTVMREDMNKKPGKSDHNPDGWAERTLREMRLDDIGPCTFPAYEGTVGTAIRSLTDQFVFGQFERLIEQAADVGPPASEAHDAATPSTPTPAPAGPPRSRAPWHLGDADDALQGRRL